MTYSKIDYYNWLLDKKLFTEAELILVTKMYGYNIETLNLAVYSRYGYRTVKDLINEMKNE